MPIVDPSKHGRLSAKPLANSHIHVILARFIARQLGCMDYPASPSNGVKSVRLCFLPNFGIGMGNFPRPNRRWQRFESLCLVQERKLLRSRNWFGRWRVYLANIAAIRQLWIKRAKGAKGADDRFNTWKIVKGRGLRHAFPTHLCLAVDWRVLWSGVKGNVLKCYQEEIACWLCRGNQSIYNKGHV